jgi:hypothetical protein
MYDIANFLIAILCFDICSPRPATLVTTACPFPRDRIVEEHRTLTNAIYLSLTEALLLRERLM